ncbi:MAG: beta-lactamase family protein [Acidimicrobiia bacterium]|nr:beta-lactamase family protein [Acidimicrobiia bacterium]
MSRSSTALTVLRSVAVIASSALLLAACGGDDTDGDSAADATTTTQPVAAAAPTTTTTAPVDDRAWPGDEWPTIDLGEAGMDRASLDELAATAEAADSQCLVVTRDGNLVDEWHWDGSTADTEREAYSVTKSITATLVGIAQDQGHLDIDQPASDFLTEWKGTPSEPITIRNLLSNDSGRFHDYQTDYVSMAVVAEDKSAFSIALTQQHDPGTVWAYNNAAIQTLEEVLERATGTPVAEFAEEHLFDPLGVESTMTTDTAGNTLAFMGLQTTCRDLARFGLLYLRGGEWDGDQVVSESFVAEAIAPSTELNPNYGFLWWLLGDAGATAPGQTDLTDDSPSGYAAIGLGNQLVVVYPDTAVIVTRLGPFGEIGIAEISEWARTVDP